MRPEEMNVVLTGACGGIGQLIARRLAAGGASLYLCGRDTGVLEGLQSELRASARDHQLIEAVAVDLTNDAETDAWLERIAVSGKPVNVLINNAGVCRFGMFERLDEQDIDLIMNLNSIVPMKLVHRLLPGLRQQPAARIVNIASTFGAIGFPGYSVYSASKYAVRGFSQSLRRELADTNVSVGCILPRATRTAINSERVVAMNRELSVAMDAPEKVAAAVVEFVDSERGELALGWPEKLLVRVNSVFPALVGRAIAKKLPLIKQYAA
jgi:short-subunit dehydrogenase